MCRSCWSCRNRCALSPSFTGVPDALFFFLPCFTSSYPPLNVITAKKKKKRRGGKKKEDVFSYFLVFTAERRRRKKRRKLRLLQSQLSQTTFFFFGLLQQCNAYTVLFFPPFIDALSSRRKKLIHTLSGVFFSLSISVFPTQWLLLFSFFFSLSFYVLASVLLTKLTAPFAKAPVEDPFVTNVSTFAQLSSFFHFKKRTGAHFFSCSVLGSRCSFFFFVSHCEITRFT